MIGGASASPRPAIEISAETMAGPRFPRPAASYWDKNLLCSCILSMDRMGRRYYGVQELSHASDNLLRLAVSAAEQRIILDGGTDILPSDAVIDLHLWNERIRWLGPSRCGLGWGSRAKRRLERSLAALAAQAESDRALAQCKAFRARPVLLTCPRVRRVSRFAEQMGLGAPVALERADLDHTLLAFALAWACLPGSPTRRRPRRATRYSFWMSRRAHYDRYFRVSSRTGATYGSVRLSIDSGRSAPNEFCERKNFWQMAESTRVAPLPIPSGAEAAGAVLYGAAIFHGSSYVWPIETKDL